MNMPDVVGYAFGDERKVLEENGFKIAAVTVTVSPRRRPSDYGEDSRVIRLKPVDGDRVEILVC